MSDSVKGLLNMVGDFVLTGYESDDPVIKQRTVDAMRDLVLSRIKASPDVLIVYMFKSLVLMRPPTPEDEAKLKADMEALITKKSANKEKACATRSS